MRSSAVRQFPTSHVFIDFHPIARATGLKDRRYRWEILGHLHSTVSDVGSVFPTEGSEYFLCTVGWALAAPTRSSMMPWWRCAMVRRSS